MNEPTGTIHCDEFTGFSIKVIDKDNCIINSNSANYNYIQLYNFCIYLLNEGLISHKSFMKLINNFVHDVAHYFAPTT